jgi:nitric oxide reductase activation protein
VVLGQPCGELAAHSRDAFTALFGAEKEAQFRDMLETEMSSVWGSEAALELAKKVMAFFGDDQDESGNSGQGDDTDSGQDDAGNSGKDGSPRATRNPFAEDCGDLDELDLGKIISGQLEEISRNTPYFSASTVALPMATVIERGAFDELAETSVHSHALRGTLVNLIEASRKQPRSTGVHGTRFDRRKVWRYTLGDDKLRIKKQRRPEVNTAVWLMLDISGSMTNVIELARRSMLAASLALDAIEGTRVGAACFPYDNGVGVMLMPGEPVRKNASRFLLNARGSTPLAEALWWSGSQLMVLPEPRRMLFVFTDGAPDEYEKSEYALKTLETVGIEVYGMAIGEDAKAPVEALFARNALVTDMRDLQKAMFAMLKNAYLGAA